MKHKIVTASELGKECWLPSRFTGSECSRVLTCKYKCKETCKAFQKVNKKVIIKTKVHANGETRIIN